MTNKIYLVIIFVSSQLIPGLSQADNPLTTKSIDIEKLDAEYTIDGEMNESVWAMLPIIDDFEMHAPIDGVPASKRTEVQIFATENMIIVGAKIYDDPDFFINTLKRDEFGDSDEFAVFFDPNYQQTNGYGFGTNAYGAESEALIIVQDASDSWDNKWKSATQIYDDHWIVEMEIPLKSMRYDENVKTWGINFTRNEPGSNEDYAWSPVPRQFDLFEVNFYGKLNWAEAPKSSKLNASLIPYITTSVNKFSGDLDAEENFEVGGDAKVALTTGLNLDLTVNPDFSQVEVDRQVTNLTRFNIFFPERRQFFLENADIFNNYGQQGIQPFYSRRIGLDPSGRTVPILAGGRLTGNINDKLRVGAFNIQSRSQDAFYGQNYSALTFQQQFGVNSNVKGIFLNRQAFDGSDAVEGDYGRNLGGEVNLSTEDRKWSGKLGYIQSAKENLNFDNRHLYGRIDYNGQRFRTFLFIQDLGENYYSDMGFNARINNFDPVSNTIQRIGYTQIGNMFNYYIYPENSETVNFHWSGIENYIVVNDGGDLNEWYTRIRHFIFFRNTSALKFRVNLIHNDLIFPFPLTAVPIPTGTYDNVEFNIQFNTDQRRIVNFEAFGVYGSFFNGHKLTYWTDISFRSQPWGNFSVGLEQNFIRLPEEFGDLDLTLATARAEINFSTSLFWTTFLQYNTQADRFNVNTRLQWRFAPMSDIYLVYTDNYLTFDGLQNAERSVVLKANYWLNL